MELQMEVKTGTDIGHHGENKNTGKTDSTSVAKSKQIKIRTDEIRRPSFIYNSNSSADRATTPMTSKQNERVRYPTATSQEDWLHAELMRMQSDRTREFS